MQSDTQSNANNDNNNFTQYILPFQPKRRTLLSDRVRSIIVHQFLAGKEITHISNDLNIKRTTVSKVIAVYKKEGRIERLQMGGDRRSKLTPFQEFQLQELINEDCTLSMERVSKEFYYRYGIKISRNIVARAIRPIHFSVKPDISSREVTLNAYKQATNNMEYCRMISSFMADSSNCVFYSRVNYVCDARYFVDDVYRHSLGEPCRSSKIDSIKFTIEAAITKNSLLFCESHPHTEIKHDQQRSIMENPIEKIITKLPNYHPQSTKIIVDGVDNKLIEKYRHCVFQSPIHTTQTNPVVILMKQWHEYTKICHIENIGMLQSHLGFIPQWAATHADIKALYDCVSMLIHNNLPTPPSN